MVIQLHRTDIVQSGDLHAAAACLIQVSLIPCSLTYSLSRSSNCSPFTMSMMMAASWQRQTIADIQVCLGSAPAQTEASVNSQYLLNT